MSEEFNFWKGMMKKYWYALIIYGIAVVGAVIGAVVVLMLYIGAPDIAGAGTWTFDDFSLGAGILWIIFIILWELLCVVLPFIVYFGIVTAMFWFVILPDEDKAAIKEREKKEKHAKKARNGGGAAGILFFIAFVLVVFIDGNLWVRSGDLSYSYYIFAYLIGFMWTCIVLGIPGLIIGILYILKKRKRISE